jgi:2-phosphosulfolactate phosphatase
MPPEYQYLSLVESNLAEGVVVVVDVLRAFTTAAFAFSSGAKEIIPVSGIEEAKALKIALPGTLLMGEDRGMSLAGFDFGNSPEEISRMDLTGRTLIQRTSAGTQGILRSIHADQIFAASFVVARATADILSLLCPEKITFVITGESLERDGDEDRACGEYIQALLQDDYADPEPYTERILTSSVGRTFTEGTYSNLSREDLRLSMMVNRFSFAMPVYREAGEWVMRKLEMGFDQELAS